MSPYDIDKFLNNDQWNIFVFFIIISGQLNLPHYWQCGQKNI